MPAVSPPRVRRQGRNLCFFAKHKASKEGSSFCEQKEAKKLLTALRALAETPHSPPAGEAHDEGFCALFSKSAAYFLSVFTSLKQPPSPSAPRIPPR
jgi:hypothetical protein